MMRLDHYLGRIGTRGPLDPSVTTLRRLHVAHRESFLFENLAIQEGGAISVALPDIERKFLDEGRGGYCFEHNTLFSAVLRACGFEVTTLLGRVRRGPPETWARTHMVLAVRIAEHEASAEPETSAERPSHWLADVGFGAIGLVEPIPLRDGAASRQRGLTYLLRREPHRWILAMQDATSQPMDLYEFSDEPQTDADVVVANHYTSTHPESIFRRSLTIQGIRESERIILRSQVLTRYSDGALQERPVDRAELPRLARDLFGVELPDRPLVFELDDSSVGARS